MGNTITLTKDDLIRVYNLSGEDYDFRAYILDTNTELVISRDEIHDPARFNDITEQFKLEQEEQIKQIHEEGHKKFTLYLLKQRLWFFLPYIYPANYAVGMIAVALLFPILFFMYRKKLYIPVTGLTALFNIFNICVIIFFYIHPLYCK